MLQFNREQCLPTFNGVNFKFKSDEDEFIEIDEDNNHHVVSNTTVNNNVNAHMSNGFNTIKPVVPNEPSSYDKSNATTSAVSETKVNKNIDDLFNLLDTGNDVPTTQTDNGNINSTQNDTQNTMQNNNLQPPQMNFNANFHFMANNLTQSSEFTFNTNLNYNMTTPNNIEGVKSQDDEFVEIEEEDQTHSHISTVQPIPTNSNNILNIEQISTQETNAPKEINFQELIFKPIESKAFNEEPKKESSKDLSQINNNTFTNPTVKLSLDDLLTDFDMGGTASTNTNKTETQWKQDNVTHEHIQSNEFTFNNTETNNANIHDIEFTSAATKTETETKPAVEDDLEFCEVEDDNLPTENNILTEAHLPQQPQYVKEEIDYLKCNPYF
jgi:hypothetical protein